MRTPRKARRCPSPKGEGRRTERKGWAEHPPLSFGGPAHESLRALARPLVTVLFSEPQPGHSHPGANA